MCLPLLLLSVAVFQWQRTGSERRPVDPTSSSFQRDIVSQDATPELVSFVEQGRPIEISAGKFQASFVFRKRHLLSDGFQFSLGGRKEGIELDATVFEGWSGGDATANLVVVGDALAATVQMHDGSMLYVRTHPETGAMEARRENVGAPPCRCFNEVGVFATRLLAPTSADDPWATADPASLRALSGVDPATGEFDKFLDPIRLPPRYEESLVDALLALVLDKEATGENTDLNLASTASLYLASVANAAAVYENQLGIRLLVQEFIMVPDDAKFDDIPSRERPVEFFQEWMETHRPQEQYGWTMATKFGAGLDDGLLGLARLRSIADPTAVSICHPEAQWTVLAHELGHNLGSDHSEEGVMAAEVPPRGVRTFFTDVAPGKTSAQAIHQFTARQLSGAVSLRHPEEIPFANYDRVVTERDTHVDISPLENDSRSVRNGAINRLALEEVGEVTPRDAGTVERLGNSLRFAPREGFDGVAWFSYSVRGNVGNDDSGWLHKGDVAVVVGGEPDAFDIVVPPGASVSLEVRSATGFTQPTQSRIQRSRDFRRLLIVEAGPDAAGDDSFEAGGDVYTIRYDASAPITRPDVVVLHPWVETGVTFNPLLNDHGAGHRWQQPDPALVGNDEGEKRILLPKPFRLVDVENLSPEKGGFFARELDLATGTRLDGRITFLPLSSALGKATLRYTVEDAAGNRATETITILLPDRVDSLVSSSLPYRYHLPTRDDFATGWFELEFDDTSWRQGRGGIGYGVGSLASTVLQGSTGAASALLRIPFNVTGASQYSEYTLRMRYDDGFVAYLNGVEVARANVAAPSPLAWNAVATREIPEAELAPQMAFSIPRESVREGINVLAIHGVNALTASPDFLVAAEIDGVIVHGDVEIIDPSVAEVQVPSGVGLLVAGSLSDPEKFAPRWSVSAEPEPGAATFDVPSALETVVRFSRPGRYVLTLSALGTEAGASVLLVRVGPPTTSGGASIRTAPAVESESLRIDLEATVNRADLEWKLFSGPGLVEFADGSAASTTAAFTVPGDYRLRLTARRETIATVADVIVSVAARFAPPIVLPWTTSELTESRATIVGSFLGEGESGDVKAFLGLEDGGEAASAWDRSLDLGVVSPGTVSATFDDLPPDQELFYRFLVDVAGVARWSPVATLRTAVGPEHAFALVDGSTSARFRIPVSDADDERWREISFNDDKWEPGHAAIGFDSDDDFRPYFSTDASAMFEKRASLYLRIPFRVEKAIDGNRLALRMRYDDAFVAYLNGVEVARSQTATSSPDGEVNWRSSAATVRQDLNAVRFQVFDIAESAALLREGTNVLAIHGLNANQFNPDFLIVPELVAIGRHRFYRDWASQFSWHDPYDSIDDADPDADGLTNLQEFAFETDPMEPTSSWGALPIPSVAGKELVYAYTRSAKAKGVRFVIEASSDLQEWHEVNATRVSGNGSRATASVSREPGATFLRLRTELWDASSLGDE